MLERNGCRVASKLELVICYVMERQVVTQFVRTGIEETPTMRLQTAQAIYTDGKLIFADPAYTPRSGTEVVVTYVVETENVTIANILKTLRGRGKGENLVEKLLNLRSEDLEHDERTRGRLRP